MGHFLVVVAMLKYTAQELMMWLLLEVPGHEWAMSLPSAGQHHSGLLQVQAIQLRGFVAHVVGEFEQAAWGQQHLPAWAVEQE